MCFCLFKKPTCNLPVLKYQFYILYIIVQELRKSYFTKYFSNTYLVTLNYYDNSKPEMAEYVSKGIT